MLAEEIETVDDCSPIFICTSQAPRLTPAVPEFQANITIKKEIPSKDFIPDNTVSFSSSDHFSGLSSTTSVPPSILSPPVNNAGISQMQVSKPPVNQKTLCTSRCQRSGLGCKKLAVRDGMCHSHYFKMHPELRVNQVSASSPVCDLKRDDRACGADQKSAPYIMYTHVLVDHRDPRYRKQWKVCW